MAISSAEWGTRVTANAAAEVSIADKLKQAAELMAESVGRQLAV